MNPVPQILIVLLFTTFESLASKQNNIQNVDLAQGTEPAQLEGLPAAESIESSSGSTLKVNELKENIVDKWPVDESNKTYAEEKSDNLLHERELVHIVLKDTTHSTDSLEQIEAVHNSTKYLVKLSIKPVITGTLESSQSSNLTESELVRIVLKDSMQRTNTSEEIKDTVQNYTEVLIITDSDSGSGEHKLTEKPLISLIVSQTSNLATAREMAQLMHLTSNKGDTEESVLNCTDSLVAPTTPANLELNTPQQPFISLGPSQISSLAESEFLVQVTNERVRQDQVSDAKDIASHFTDVLAEVVTTTTATAVEDELSSGSSASLGLSQNSNLAEGELVPFINLTVKQNQLSHAAGLFTEAVTEVDTISTTPAAREDELSTKPFITLEMSQTSNLTESALIERVLSLKDVRNLTETQNGIRDTVEIITESLGEVENVTTTTTAAAPVDDQLTTNSTTVAFEEYAVKEMNFILDHLLLETQEFVATVLQATINSVFPRDQLKLYAEGVSSLLNPATDSNEDIINDNKTASSQDEIYEGIVKKLNFLKSKPSKFLQRHLPQDWINAHRNKRAELLIWLDKAIELMHKEFNCYTTEEDDYIKYKYFNETFDDISRATEIHQKLALLADLVKIVKNKKQITFMDLYMQT